MIARIQGGRLEGHVPAVTSKSCAHRALIAAALADRETIVRIDADNLDIRATAACLTMLGARISQEGSVYRVTPVKKVNEAALDCGESGSTLRFLIPVAAMLGTTVEFTGHGRLPTRPHTPLCEALRRHGVLIDSDTLPMRVEGQLESGEYRLAGNVSSQYISGLLFALPCLQGDSRIILTTKLESESYIGLTINALSLFGVRIERTETGYFIPGGQRYVSPGEIAVEGDWSAAAFYMVANALGSNVRVDGLRASSAQGDRAIMDVLAAMNAPGELRGTCIDATDIPDLVPILAVAASLAKGKTRIFNAGRLRDKECDRLEVMKKGLHAMGAKIQKTDDGLEIDGGTLHGAVVLAHNDHRIAMALAIAALYVTDGTTSIFEAESVAKSYPAFWTDLKALGGRVVVE